MEAVKAMPLYAVYDFWLTLDLYKCGSQGILLSVCGSNSDVCAGLVED